MTIDTKRLETDAAYWDEVAPDGATHYSRLSGEFLHKNDFGNWFRRVGSDWLIHNVSHTNLTERPATPAAPEWDGEGLPPIGTVCEKAPNWYKCEIIAEHDGGLVVYDMHSLDYYKVGLGMNFRPLRTKEQRQREELIDLISHHPIYKNAVNTLADDIIAAGWTKP